LFLLIIFFYICNVKYKLKVMKRKVLLQVLFLLFVASISANNIQISNARLASVDTVSKNIQVSFDISWDNSWRVSGEPNNWDAAWVFMKYKVGSTGTWKHAMITDIGHCVPVEGIADVGFVNPSIAYNQSTNPGLGAFIYRSGNGNGTFSLSNVELRWNYGFGGVIESDSIQIQVMGIEMVYIPQGSFYLGSGGGDNSAFYKYPSTSAPYLVTSEAAISVGATNDFLYYPYQSSYAGDRSGPIPSNFPKGYNAVYCMKYEISMGQYTDFLNTLTREQQNARTLTNISTDIITNIYVMSNTNVVSFNNTITCSPSNNGTTNPIVFSTTTPDIACNFLSWADGLAYSDWAGLRPMTELEFEKICRGTAQPVGKEYAWGSAGITTVNYNILNSGLENEAIGNPSTTGNASYLSTSPNYNGPLRCGIFASSAVNKTRYETGATYYGVMEMSGNIWERVVSVGNSTGRGFNGAHGDGQLGLQGEANAVSWPGANGVGSGYKGGSFAHGATTLQVSDRSVATYSLGDGPSQYGFRSVRNAPSN